METKPRYPLTISVDTAPWLNGDFPPSFDTEAEFFMHVRKLFWELDPTLDQAYMSAILINTALKPENKDAFDTPRTIEFKIQMHQDEAEKMMEGLPQSFRLGFLVARLLP